MKYLVIAEKPSLGRAIADALPGTSSGKDPIVKGDYTITWLYGHILTLKEPQDYDEKYASWTLDDLPIYFDNWAQKPIDTAKEKLKQIGHLLEDAESVIHAGDPDDEGQYLVDEVLKWFKYKGPVYRLDTGNTTIPAMQKALRSMKNNAEFVKNGEAAYARSVADLIVGVNMTRFFTKQNGGNLLSVGRVQTPTLGLVVNRDYLIENHISQKYFVINGIMHIDDKDVPITVRIPKDDPRLEDGHLLNRDEAQKIVDAINGKTFDNVKIEKKEELEYPPLPFNLVKLQTYCGNKFGYDPKTVLDITQDLREKYKAITYNRSDCQYLSMDHFREAPKTTDTVCQNIGYRPKLLNTSIKSKAFNDALITAHFAIIPSDISVDISKFTKGEKDVYLAICKYYLAQFLPPAKKLKTTLRRDVNGVGTISGVSTVILEPGYRSIFSEAKKDDVSALSDIPAGIYTGTVSQASIEEKETKPPARYTKTSLNEDMTRISKYVDDPEIKRLLLAKDEGKEGENGSIGTSATRAAIIENLIKRGYLEVTGKKLISTKLGREFYGILPDELKKADMTAKWWVMQESIKRSECDTKALPESVLETCRNVINTKHEKVASATGRFARKEVGTCPRCGKPVIEGKVGFGCSGYKEGCKFVIWKKQKSGLFKNVTISEAMAKKLLSGGKVHSKKLYSPTKDKNFEADFKLADKGSQYGASYELEFSKK